MGRQDSTCHSMVKHAIQHVHRKCNHTKRSFLCRGIIINSFYKVDNLMNMEYYKECSNVYDTVKNHKLPPKRVCRLDHRNNIPQQRSRCLNPCLLDISKITKVNISYNNNIEHDVINIIDHKEEEKNKEKKIEE